MDDSLKQRRAVAADAAAIRALTRAAYAKWVAVIGREPAPMVADYDASVHEHRFDLLEADGAMAALIETIDEADHLLIENLAVAPTFQGRGLARRLLAHAEALAADLGYREIRLYTNKQFRENIALYLKFGYHIDSEAPFRGGWTVNMSKRISPGLG